MSFSLLRCAGLALLTLLVGCSPVERISTAYEESFYEVERQIPDTLSTEPTNFIAYGDTQAGWRAEHKFYRSSNWLTWKHALFPFYQAYLLANGLLGALNYGLSVPDYGNYERRFMQKALLHAAQDRNPEFFVHLGDMAAHDGRRPAHWATFLEEYHDPDDSLSAYPFLPVIGNHEYANSEVGRYNYDAIFDYPPFYVQDMPNGAVFVLNSSFIVDQHDFLTDAEQADLFEEWFVDSDPGEQAWLEEQLAQRENRSFKVVAMHHPLFSFGRHSENWYQRKYGENLVERRAQLLDLLAEYRVQLVLSGHEHLYEHTVLQVPEDSLQEVPLHQVISSGGGTPVRPPSLRSEIDRRFQRYTDEGYDLERVMQRSVYHYTAVQVGKDSMRVETVAVDDEPPFRSYVLDAFAIPAPSATREQRAGR